MNLQIAAAATATGSVLTGSLIHAALLTGDTLPLWVQIAGVLGTPAMAGLAILVAVFHVGRKVDAVQEQSEEFGKRLDGRLTEMMKALRQQYKAEDEQVGYDKAVSDAKAITDKENADDALRAQGASALLAAQATPPAESAAVVHDPSLLERITGKGVIQ